MKPKRNSRRLLSITQSKAKMFEYEVPEAEHVAVTPSRLLPLSVGMLGDLAATINSGRSEPEQIQTLRNSLPFSARFFDAYVQTRIDSEIAPYLLVLGSAAYYLSELPGSSLLLAKSIRDSNSVLAGFGLGTLLTWILKREYATTIDLQNSPFREFLLPIPPLLRQHDADGTGDQELLEHIKELRAFIYQQGTPRQLLLADLIGAMIKKRLENSTWGTLPRYSDIEREKWAGVLRKTTFIKEFWPAQHRLGEKGIFRGKSAIVQMPTSAGKTKAVEIIIRSAFLSTRITLAVIVAPFRALCHEIKGNLIGAFQGEAISIDELSDVFQIDFSTERLLLGRQVLIVTPEKLNYVLRHSPELADKIGLLIYDEGHQFDNGTRGITYELLLTALKARIPPSTQTILISAVISNADQIGRWLLGDEFEIVSGNNILPTFRSIAFTSWQDQRGRLEFVQPQNIDEEEFYVPRVIEQCSLLKKGKESRERVFPEKSEGNEIALYLGLKLASKGGVAIFCGQKKTVTRICNKAVDIFERKIPLQPPSKTIANKSDIHKLVYLHEANMGAEATATRSAQLGIYAHHNNIPHGIRLAVEHAIKEEMASFVVCTSTLAQGVNLPIRYLFVSSFYQAGQQIEVRDFQNLIGRSGRSDKHTEGSIIFSDPVVFDERRMKDGSWRWHTAKTLLDPVNSKPCASVLYSIFDDLQSDDERRNYPIDPFALIEAYNNGHDALESELARIVAQHADQNLTIDGVRKHATARIDLIAAIESYLMAQWDESHPELDIEGVAALARGTLAYFLANEVQREKIVRLFVLLARNIAERVPDVQTRSIFGKTLFGLQDAASIALWLHKNLDEFLSLSDEAAILNLLWPLLVEHVHNRAFRNCDKPELLGELATRWIAGQPFHELHRFLVDAGARMIAKSKRFQYDVEDIVDICENGFAYNGMLLVGAVIEFLQGMNNIGIENLVRVMRSFQKQLKYGLSNQVAITLFELGFSDRIVSTDLGSVFADVQPDKEHVKLALRSRREQVFERLNRYPAYFSEVYRIIAT
jgi:POLQ-like helicase